MPATELSATTRRSARTANKSKASAAEIAIDSTVLTPGSRLKTTRIKVSAVKKGVRKVPGKLAKESAASGRNRRKTVSSPRSLQETDSEHLRAAGEFSAESGELGLEGSSRGSPYGLSQLRRNASREDGPDRGFRRSTRERALMRRSRSLTPKAKGHGSCQETIDMDDRPNSATSWQREAVSSRYRNPGDQIDRNAFWPRDGSPADAPTTCEEGRDTAANGTRSTAGRVQFARQSRDEAEGPWRSVGSYRSDDSVKGDTRRRDAERGYLRRSRSVSGEGRDHTSRRTPDVTPEHTSHRVSRRTPDLTPGHTPEHTSRRVSRRTPDLTPSRGSRRYDQTVEMPKYDGTGDLELFLRKFHILADYFRWNNDEKLFRLKTCVYGDAQYLLLDLNHINRFESFEEQFRGQFGSSAHAEHYRAELSHLRRGSMSLGQLHLKVRSLVSKAAPGPWSALTEVYARDAFLTALGDEQLRDRIMMSCPPPETLAAVFDLALRAYAVRESRTADQESTISHHPAKPRYACGVTQPATDVVSDAPGQLDSKLRTLQTENCKLNQQLTEVLRQLERLQSSCQTSQSSVQSAPAESSRTRPASRGNCYRCGKPGHYARECPTLRTAPTSSTNGNSSGNCQGRTNVIGGAKRRAAVYLTFVYEGIEYRALLDSGCDNSVLGRKVLPGLAFQEDRRQLLAANATPIPILGSANVSFQVAGMMMIHTFLVSDAVEEVILGSDWLEEQGCIWNFEESTILIGSSGTPVKLGSSANRDAVCRIYAAETVKLPPRCQQDIQVKPSYSRIPARGIDWLLEPRRLEAGLMLARTLLPSGDCPMFVRVINCSNESKVLRADRALGVADPVCEPFSQQLEPETEREPGSGTQTDDAHIQCLIEGLPSSLTEEQREMAARFLKEKASIFSKSATDLGRNRMIPHRIDTGNHPPVRQPLRRQPYAQLEEIERNVQELLKAGVIRPSTSAWSSNVLLVKKKDGSSRFCVDMRKVNDVTVKQAYPLPHIDACLESLGGANFFSTLDLRSGYFQVELHPDDAEKTAFVTRSGHYEFTVLSMGLANAPSQFQRLMDLVLSGLVWESCLVYLDDVIIFSETFEQHLERLDAVFSRLANANLLLKASKCQLFCESVKFLGHIVSRQGIAADPSKLATVRNWPQPTCLTELMSFIGLCSYYRKFVEGFATIAKPLHVLTGKGQPFFWGPDQEAAFQTLKVRLTEAPILASPVNEGEYVLDTDASLTGLGGVLQQRQGGEIRVIAYVSRCLTRAERNYSTTRRELLAVIHALKQFRTFLLGRHFLLRVDHSALTYLRKTPEVMGQAARWLDYIEQYQFTIEHRNGKAHGNCDGLSRRPCSEEEKNEPGHPCCRRARNITTTKEPEDSPSLTVAEGALDLTPVAVGLAQKEDPEIWPIWKAAKLADQPPTWKEIQSTTETTRALWGQFKSLKVIDDVLYREYYDSKGVVAHLQLVLPRSHRLFFLQSIHELYRNIGTAHLGVRKTQQHVSQRAYWPTWKTDVERYCRRCIVCQSVQHGVAPRHGLMQLYEPNGMGDRLHVDLTGPHIPSRQGATYILTAIDAFTRFLVAVPLRDKRAITVAEALVDRVILPFGCWRTLVSDQGSEWCNELLVEVTKVMGIQKLRTTAYRASANGRIERVHRTINDLLSKVVSENQRDWQDFLPKIVTAYNAASHETTGMSPFYLTYGRPYCTPLDLVINAPEVKPCNVWDYVNELENKLRQAYSIVNEHLHTETQRMKKRYDARVRPLIFQSGDLAFYYCPRRRAGRNHKWARLCQVCRIERPLNDVLYLVRVKPKGKALVVHVDRLKAFSGEIPSCWEAVKGRADVGGRNPNTVVQQHGESDDFRQTRQAERLPSPPRETTTNTRPRNTSPPAADKDAAVQTGRYFLRQPEQCRRPMRLWAARILTARRPEIATIAPETGRRSEVNTERSGPITSRARNSDRSSCINRSMEGQTSSLSATEPKRRRKRNRGPWNCELCQRPPFGSISGFRNHVILNHGKDCSWTGVTRAPQSAEQLSQLVERAKRSRGHRERGRKRPRISVDGGDDASAAGIETARAVPRVCRIRLASPPLEATTSDTGSLTDVCVVSEARMKSAEASSRATQTEHVARVSTESQTPLMGAMYLPDGLSLDMVLDVVHAHPGLSSSALVDLIGRSRTAGLPSEQYLILELIIRGMTMAANRLAAVVATQVIRAAQLPAGEEGERHRAAVQEFVNGLVNRPPRDPPTRPPPLDLTAIPAEIDVLEAIERRFVFQRRLIGRRPPSPPISYLIDGSGYSTIDISDTEYEVGTNVTSTSSENGLD